MSEIGKYNYLKKYINTQVPYPSNWFEEITLDDITKSEQNLGFEFPNQLKEFWQEIGYGALYVSKNGENSGLVNRIMPPEEIADIFLRREETESNVLPFVFDDLKPDDMIFFEIGDSSSFLIMRPKGKTPNMVYDLAGGKIDDFETFIYRLYHESPKYFLYLDDKDAEEDTRS